ncbi:transporter substrate-binding domain-containing protein [Brevibacillus sp. NRS-1366]|uniref:transporter substrate-binding domain-containing protein n=1 Tax=Brevibacillus sp. NRS-1366 TaxID=3233899 RepID=UPI003D23AA06
MKKSMKTVSMIVLLVGSLLVGCGNQTTTGAAPAENKEGASATVAAESGQFKLLETGKLTFAMSGMYKPFNYKDGGELKGFDVEIGKALSKKMGLEPNPVATPWETILQGLKANKFDTIIGSMAYTEERAKQVNFTKPYYLSGGQIFVSSDNDSIKTADDLKGKKIGVVAQSTYYEAAQKYTKDVKNYTSDVTALKDLTVPGRLDAVITAPVVGYEAIKAGLAVKEAGDPLWIEQACIAVPKENEALLNALNKAIDEMIADGTYEEISNSMFGTNLLKLKTEGIPVYK